MMPQSPPRTRQSTLLVAAIIAGIDGNLLLRGGQWRAGFALWIAGLALTVFLLGVRAHRDRLWMLVGVTAAAFGLVWRDSELLYAIDLLSVLCMGVLLIWQGSGRGVRDLTVVQAVRAVIVAALNTIAGAPGVLTRDATTTSATGTSTTRPTIRALAVGVALAALPVFIVTQLLSSSDAVFSSVVYRLFGAVVTDGLSHLFVVALLAWMAAGWFRASLGDAIGTSVPDPASPRLPFLTVSVVLYALLTVLLAFVVTQARVLFGGAEFLRTTADLSVASYARDGFFQLIVAAGVVLATLLVVEWLLADDDGAARRHYRRVSAVVLTLVALVLVSSATRIVLYVNEFGLSTDRAFASAAIVWVAAVLLAFVGTTLRDRPTRFMRAAIVVSIGWVALVNFVNLEALVVRVNLARASAGAPFDAAYHARLSGDALPELLGAAERIAPTDCVTLHAGLRAAWTKRFADPEESSIDWRSTNLPMRRAHAWYAALSKDSAPSCVVNGMTRPRP